MSIKTRIEPVGTFIEALVREDLSSAAQARAVGRFAREQLADAQATNRMILGRVPPHKTFVDGREGARPEDVRPGGKIVFEFDLIEDVLRWIANELVLRSPFRTGQYARSHTLFADGREIRLGEQIPFAMEYSFTNAVPYARKIEIGTTRAGRAFVIQVPNRIYERTARDARARFGNMAKISFTWRGVVGGAQPAAGARGTAHNKSGVRFPTILIETR